MNNPFTNYIPEDANLNFIQMVTNSKKMAIKYEGKGKGKDMLHLITTVLIADKKKNGNLSQILNDALDLSEELSFDEGVEFKDTVSSVIN
jgi:hypothetical protein